MAKILICDDESGLRSIIKRYATFEGHEVLEACDGMQAVEISLKEQIDIIIMDVTMPVMDGFSAVKKIRKTSEIPILMLSACGEEYNKICGFQLGIDDYVVKPFSSKEIMMRVNAILKRTQKSSKPDRKHNYEVFRKDGFEADMTAHKVFIDGVQADMAPKEYDLLFYLIRNKNIAVPRGKLLNEIWGYDYYGDSRTLDTHMKLLRQSLGPYAGLITTIRGLGYRFEG
ncbi:response regulator transcription factor [Pseudobacteroides cellulosolvens]|uniref:Stage 0 sporulation protein A homolog n=1 Tax=Pseudobacteroides cellulosolvens ATCC 35603 = DSM 2933 TaxID=398512 RepID=A0A0L6JKZ0_9FIRM|nr:response regulator transcription factor [Pseudobacteroides cellulosolvens]KNY26486.1 two component transcriptional regulator, winged helix family [Pseudobacteroides cellulosolvens ATCC 35603 = DSM 2933]